MITKKISLLLALGLLIQVFSFLQAQNMITVHPESYPAALRNPLMGFRPGLEDIGDPDYPYTTIVRQYIKWNQIENDASDGVQKIIDFCNDSWEGLEEANVKVIPRIYLDWDSNAGNEYWPADLTNGDWSSPEFKERVINLIYKLGEAWDNDPRVAWVQTGIIGYWGEQESPVGVDEDGWGQRLGEAFSTAFKNKKLLVRNQQSWPGYELGVYWDSYGHPGQTSGAWTRIRETTAQGRYLNQVVEGEVAYNWGETSFDPLYGGEPEITLDDYRYTNNMINVIRELHCTGLGWISSYMEIDQTSIVNLDSIRKNADRMQKEFGYRFIIPEFSCSSRADQGQNIAINFKVKNVGSAPFYEDWPVAFVLIDEATGAIVWKEILPGVDIRNWRPGSAYNYSTKAYNTPAQEYSIDASFTVPENILSGQYLTGISILEPTTQTPGVFFAVKNFLATNQTQPLCRIGIGEDIQGDYNVTATNDDPLLDDARYYSSSADNFNVAISYPTQGAGIVPQIEIPVYVSASNNGGTIDSVQLYVNGILERTSFSAPYIFSLANLPSDLYTIEVRAYDDKGTMKSDSKTFTVQFPGGVPWVEQFNLPNGTKSDNGNTAWTSTRGGGVFEVRNGVFEVSNGTGFVGEFTTGVIKTYGAPVTVSLDVVAPFSGLDAGQDYVELYKIVDGVKTLIDRVTGYQSKTFTESNIIGNEIQFVIKGYVTFVSEVYNFDNLSVTYDVQPETRYLTLNVNGNGKVNPSAGVYPYYKNADAVILATPSYGYKLDHWSGDYSGTENPIIVKMDTGKIITANFIELPKYSLSVTAENGTVSLSASAESYYEGAVITLTANPNAGYKFSNWTGDLSGSVNPVSITMDADKNITATFDIQTALDELLPDIPGQNSLEQNYPNPFYERTTIPYQLNKASHIRLSVFNFLGEKVAILVDQYQQPGYYRLDWNAKDHNGIYLTDGIYFCRLEINNYSFHSKMTILTK